MNLKPEEIDFETLLQDLAENDLEEEKESDLEDGEEIDLGEFLDDSVE